MWACSRQRAHVARMCRVPPRWTGKGLWRRWAARGPGGWPWERAAVSREVVAAVRQGGVAVGRRGGSWPREGAAPRKGGANNSGRMAGPSCVGGGSNARQGGEMGWGEERQGYGVRHGAVGACCTWAGPACSREHATPRVLRNLCRPHVQNLNGTRAWPKNFVPRVNFFEKNSILNHF